MKTILIVEDDDNFRSMLRQMLERSGFGVIEAEDGLVGGRLYREKRPDLVLTDLIMPNKEGIELIVELRKDFPDIRIVAYSGGASFSPDPFLDAAIDLGAKCTLRKPFEQEDLIAAVEGSLSH